MPGGLVNGKFVGPDPNSTNWYAKGDGKYIRGDSQFRNFITRDGSSGFKAEPGRYHLYVSYACPWAHRTLIFLKLKGLEEIIGTSIVDAHAKNEGWTFGEEGERTRDDLYGFHHLHQLYTKTNPRYTGKVSVPVLWDKHKETIVNNESSEIIRMLNQEFTDFVDPKSLDLYPEGLRTKIDKMNDFVYHNINNGVYKTGMAGTQETYEEAFNKLFGALDHIESLLSRQRFLVGDQMTEADWRLFPTLIRFDAVYVGHFKCNLRRIADYEHLNRYLKELYNYPGIKDTVNMDHIKRHYYMTHKCFNPSGIVPAGPQLDL